MPDIHIQRSHKLGLERAREVALQWAEEVERKFDMECTILEGDDGDVVEFKRIGVNGRLEVAAAHFELQAKLGFLLGAFSKTIESEIERNLDQLLEAQPKEAKAAPTKSAAKPAAKAARPAKAAKPAARAGKKAG